MIRERACRPFTKIIDYLQELCLRSISVSLVLASHSLLLINLLLQGFSEMLLFLQVKIFLVFRISLAKFIKEVMLGRQWPFLWFLHHFLSLMLFDLEIQYLSVLMLKIKAIHIRRLVGSRPLVKDLWIYVLSVEVLENLISFHYWIALRDSEVSLLFNWRVKTRWVLHRDHHLRMIALVLLHRHHLLRMHWYWVGILNHRRYGHFLRHCKWVVIERSLVLHLCLKLSVLNLWVIDQRWLNLCVYHRLLISWRILLRLLLSSHLFLGFSNTPVAFRLTDS